MPLLGRFHCSREAVIIGPARQQSHSGHILENMGGKGKENKWIGGQTGFFLLFFHDDYTKA